MGSAGELATFARAVAGRGRMRKRREVCRGLREIIWPSKSVPVGNRSVSGSPQLMSFARQGSRQLKLRCSLAQIRPFSPMYLGLDINGGNRKSIFLLISDDHGYCPVALPFLYLVRDASKEVFCPSCLNIRLDQIPRYFPHKAMHLKLQHVPQLSMSCN